MVPKKHKSKRIEGREKFKIVKRAAEGKRKARKEQRKNPVRKALKKDPGIPNMFPFKEKLMQQALMAKELQKKPTLEAYAVEAARKSRAHEINQLSQLPAEVYRQEAAVAGKRDNSKKAYYREFKKVIEQADVILEILDVRDPLGCRTKEIEELIMNCGSDKRIILILNKIDLVPRENVEAWLKYLRNELPTVAFKASTQTQRSNLGQSQVSIQNASSDLLSGSECIGADNLIMLLKNYCRSSNLKTSITVGVVGFPNVGKSSVINSLKRSKVCGVGSTPGVTKVAQIIQLDKNIKLLDCPGIVFSKGSSDVDSASVLLRNCVKVELLEDPVSPVQVIVSRCSKEQLMDIYAVPYFIGVDDFLISVARQRGKLRRGGVPDIESAARSVIQDWNQGRIPFYTLPPASGAAVESHISSSLVQNWSQEFQITSLEDEATLKVSKPRCEIPSKMYAVNSIGTVAVDMDMDEDQLPSEYRNEESEQESGDEEIDEDEMEIDESDIEDDVILPEALKPVMPEIRFTPISKKQRAAEKVVPALSFAEKQINPQHNIVQTQKKMLKAKKKMQRRANNGGDSQMGDSKYDFKEHFEVDE